MILEFDSYYISPIQEKDAWSLCDFAVANEDRLKRYFPKTLEQNLTPTLSKAFTNRKVKQFNDKEEFLFTLKVQKTNILLGLIYIKEIDWTIKQGEFAYCIGYTHEGKGLTTQSVKTLIKYANKTLALKTLQIIAHKDNKGSIKVAKNCNFVWQKTLKNAFTPTNENAVDMELYELYL